MVRSPLAGPLAIIVAVILLANLARVYAPRARTPLPLPSSHEPVRGQRHTDARARAAASAQPARPTLARIARGRRMCIRGQQA